MTSPVSTATDDIAAVVAAPASHVLPRQRTTQPVADRFAPPPRRAARSRRPLDCVVIGGGFAGLQSALDLADAGMRVTVLEQSRELMGGASRNNMARIHHGWHYPGSTQTALECVSSAFEFLERYDDVLIRDDSVGHRRAYRSGWCVLTRGSFTDASDWLESAVLLRNQYETEVARRGLSFGPVDEFFRVLPKRSWAHRINPESVVLAARTLEPFVDLTALADKVITAVLRHPRISVSLRCEVTGASPDGDEDGSIRLAVRSGREGGSILTHRVVNASWSSRNVLDSHFAAHTGQRAPASVTHRLRAFLRVRLPARTRDLPSLLFVHGPFCSFTNCGDGTGMVSYEPVSCLASAADVVPPDWAPMLSGQAMPTATAELSRDILRGAERFVPELGQCDVLQTQFATLYHEGSTDIFDPESAIHHRLGTGVSSLASNWLSLDTGKMSWVPRYAREAAQLCLKV